MTVVVFAWGNSSRGDDAVGPLFADWLRQRAFADVVLVEDMQLQVEHVLDCQLGNLLLFIDACHNQQHEILMTEVNTSTELAHTSHALTPAELLGCYRRVFAKPAPVAFLLTIAGRHFELGQNMSGDTYRHCQRAMELLTTLLHKPCPNHWRNTLHNMEKSHSA